MTIRTWSLGLALLAGGAGWAAGQPAGAFNPREFFELLDANNDQVIEKSEVPESGRAAFDKLLKNGDSNKNGRLEMAEYRELLSSLREPGAPAPSSGTNPGGVGNPMQRFEAADKNGDGKLTKEEWPGLPEVFARIDADKDGFVTREEATRFFRTQAAASQGGQALLARLKELDKNGDSKVSKEEFAGPEPLFNRLDSDSDGFITKEEAESFRPGPGALGPERFKVLDKNEDGKLSRDEFDGPAPLFDRIDADNDGFITPQEIRAATQAAQAKNAAAKQDAPK